MKTGNMTLIIIIIIIIIGPSRGKHYGLDMTLSGVRTEE